MRPFMYVIGIMSSIYLIGFIIGASAGFIYRYSGLTGLILSIFVAMFVSTKLVNAMARKEQRERR